MKKITINKIKKKKNKTPIICLTAYCKTIAEIAEKYCDIMLSAEILSKDAIQNKINFYDHVAHLIVHSLLHISGYTHNKNHDYLTMKRKEIAILNNLGIADPYN